MRSLIMVASVMTVVVIVMGSAMLRNFGGARMVGVREQGLAAVLTALCHPLKKSLKIARQKYQDTWGSDIQNLCTVFQTHLAILSALSTASIVVHPRQYSSNGTLQIQRYFYFNNSKMASFQVKV
ncbi:hypothetical protein C8J57DRAFT_1381249 [Mycena rebaudengoi]|nr:hypothetical protein C8J57DRAFT_1381249 [Mycena rebaudengoi]